MSKDTENPFILACIITDTIERLANYYWNERGMWGNEAAKDQVAMKAAEHGLGVIHEGDNTLLFYPISTRRKRPAFAAVTRGMQNKYEEDAHIIWARGRLTIVGVEAKTHAILAGESEAAPARGET